MDQGKFSDRSAKMRQERERERYHRDSRQSMVDKGRDEVHRKRRVIC